MFGDIVECWKPAFVELLAAAGVVESNYGVRLQRFEIGGRIVEGEMAVFSDADEGDINLGKLQFVANSFHQLAGIFGAAQKMVLADADFIDEALAQIFAEAGGVSFGEADIFVEMKHFDAAPIDAGHGGEGREKFELRSAGGGDDAGFATGRDGFANDGGGMIRGSSGERLFVRKLL